MISNGYNMIKWGILISVIHVYILGSFEVLPAFVGYFMIMRGMYSICDETKLEYMTSLKGESTRLFILSLVYWVFGIFFGYQLAISKMVLIVFYLFDVLFFGNLLNKTVKYLKENMLLAEADKLRTGRMNFVKAYMALIVFFAISMIPALISFLNIGNTATLDFISTVLQYIFISLMLILKLWLSILIQKYSIR